MELSFRSGRTGLLSNWFLTFLLSMVLGMSLAFAGGMPPDARKKASTMEQDVEIKESAPEVKEEPVAEPSADAAFTDETTGEMSWAQEDGNRGFTVGVRGCSRHSEQRKYVQGYDSPVWAVGSYCRL